MTRSFVSIDATAAEISQQMEGGDSIDAIRVKAVFYSLFFGDSQPSIKNMARLLFKLAVEQAMMMHIIACDTDIDEVQLDQLRGQCIGEVKRTNGQISFKDALRYQKSL